MEHRSGRGCERSTRRTKNVPNPYVHDDVDDQRYNPRNAAGERGTKGRRDDHDDDAEPRVPG